VKHKTELLLSEAHEINLYACLDVISFRHVIAYRRSLLKFVGSNLTPAEAFSGVPCYLC